MIHGKRFGFGFGMQLPLISASLSFKLREMGRNPERMSAASKESISASVLAPLFIGISTLVSPQGVGVYWFTNTLLTTAQLKFTQNQVAAEFPEYKKIKDAVDAEGEGMRYTRTSPFVKNDLVEKSVKDLEEPSGNAEVKPESRSARRKKRGKSRARSS